MRDDQRQEAEVPQEVLGNKKCENLKKNSLRKGALKDEKDNHWPDLFFTYLWSADFIEGDKDGSVQETAECQIRVKGPWRHQQQDELWQERRQAKPLAPPAVCTEES